METREEEGEKWSQEREKETPLLPPPAELRIRVVASPPEAVWDALSGHGHPGSGCQTNMLFYCIVFTGNGHLA